MPKPMLDWIRKYGRITNSTDFIPEIDGLRFFCIFIVMAFHLNSTLAFHWRLPGVEFSYAFIGGDGGFFDFGWWIRRMDLGVRVFFAVSGFVLAIPFVKSYLQKSSPVSLRSYFYRRIMRIEPPFILSVILFTVAYWVMNDVSFKELMYAFLPTIGYFHNFYFGYPSPINPVTWSLETEIQFYLLFPFLFGFVFAYRNRIWITACFAIFIFGFLHIRELIVFDNNPHFNTSLLFYISNFFVGVLFCYWYFRYKVLFFKKNTFWDLTALVAILVLFYFYKPQDRVFNNFMFNFALLFLFVGVFKGALISKIVSNPVIYVTGGMCYSLYLLHLGVFHFFTPLFLPFFDSFGYAASLFAMTALILPLTLAFGWLFYVYVERPTMNAKWFKLICARIFNKRKNSIERS